MGRQMGVPPLRLPVKNLALNKRAHDLPQYCLNCTNFGKLILMKIIEIAATGCHILKLKCTKFDFGLTALPQTP